MEAFPNVLLIYYPDLGLGEVRVLRHSPYEDAFNPNDMIEQYRIETPGGEVLFVCAA